MLLLCREIIGVACKDLTQHTDTLCGKSADFSRFAAVVYRYPRDFEKLRLKQVM